MKIIKATPDHAPDIARLNDAVQKLHADHHPDVFKYPTDASEMESFFREKIQTDDHVVFMARIDGKGVGYLWCQIQRRDENLFKHAMARLYICQLSVDPDHSGNGVGRELMRAAEHLARENDIHAMALDTWMFNGNATDFSKNSDFRPSISSCRKIFRKNSIARRPASERRRIGCAIFPLTSSLN